MKRIILIFAFIFSLPNILATRTDSLICMKVKGDELKGTVDTDVYSNYDVFIYIHKNEKGEEVVTFRIKAPTGKIFNAGLEPCAIGLYSADDKLLRKITFYGKANNTLDWFFMQEHNLWYSHLEHFQENYELGYKCNCDSQPKVYTKDIWEWIKNEDGYIRFIVNLYNGPCVDTKFWTIKHKK